MPFVRGFLRIRRKRDLGGPVDPDYGVDEGEIDEGGGEYPDIGLPEPPPGIWPPLTPEQPWRPIDPGFGVPSFPERPSTGPVPIPPARPGAPDQGLPTDPPTAGHLPSLPPGTIWPPLPPGVRGKYLALVLIGGGGHGAHYRYVVIDADYRPELPERPQRPEPK